ncbi:MAG: LysR family transcriptional regulator [Actinomycetota bacterium]
MDVHLRDLRYFVAVAEELHFTRAAERLFISQPALSRQIAKLEADLRVPLLERDRRTVALAAAGAVLLDRARDLLQAWDHAQGAVSDAAATSQAVVRIGMQTSVGRGIVGHMIDGLTQQRPGWTVQLQQVTWDDPTSGLADQTSDVALCWLPVPDPALCDWLELATEPRRLAVAATHPLANRRTVEFADIAELSLVALPESAGPLRDYWLAQDRRCDPAPVAATAHTADEAMEAVAAGLGAVLISEGNIAIYDRPGITFLSVTDLEPSTLALVWASADTRAVVHDLIDIARHLDLSNRHHET